MSETKPQKPFPKPMAWHDDPGFVVGFSGERDSDNWLIGIVLTRGEVGSTMVFDQRWPEESVNNKFVDLPDDHPLAAWPNAIKPTESKKEQPDSIEAERRKLWCDIAGLTVCINSKEAPKWADEILAEFDKRFKK